MTRRSLLGATAAPLLAAARNRPNVLFLIADDMNDYGFWKATPGIQTPHLDRFLESAIAFERAYCASPVCVPSRASFFSGLQPHTTGAYLNGSDPWDKSPLKSIECMPETFHRGGYRTFGRGKLFHAPIPEPRGRRMWSNEYWGGGFGPFPPLKDQVIGQFWGVTPWEGPDSDFPDVKNADACIDLLGRKHDAPFLMIYGLWRPHTPFTAPKRFFEPYRLQDMPVPVPGYKASDLDDVPPAGRKLAAVWGERFDPARWPEFLRGYYACTSFADWNAGRVIEALDRSPYRDNTIVIFVSDNGYHCGEKNHWGEKGTLWEQSALVPLAVRMPAGRNCGKRSGRTVGLIDLYPTLVDLCGLAPPPQRLEGRSLRPLLDKPSAGWDRPALTTYGEGLASVRDERFRYIRYADGSEELYDHQEDPHEWTNVARDRKFAETKAWLARIIPSAWAPTLGGRLG